MMYSVSLHPTLLIFLINFLSYILNVLAPSFFSNLIWTLYTSFPTSLSKKLKEQRELRLEVIRLRNEIRGTSAQDQFAKWAKSKRKHDEKMSKLEELNLEVNIAQTKLTAQSRLLRWALTQGAKLFFTLYYIKTPMFYIPAGLVPGYIEFLLALPKAPKGSISVLVWTWACTAAVEFFVGVVVIQCSQWVLDKTGRRKAPARES